MPSHLADYAAYLRQHRAADVAREYLTWVRSLDIEALRPFLAPGADRTLLVAAVDEYLTDLEQGTTLARARLTIARIQQDALPGVARAAIAPHDVVRVYAARKATLLAFLPDYTKDQATSLAIVGELDRLIAQVQEEAFAAFIGIRDAATRKVAELEARERVLSESLRVSEARLRLMVRYAPIAIIAYDRRGTITYAGGQGLEALGMLPIDLVGRNAVDVFGTDPHTERIQRVLAGEVFSTVGEFGGRSFQTWFSPLPNPLGEIDGFVGISVDVTDRVRADALKEQFLGILSHELRTPINAIMGFGSILDDGLAGPLNADQHGYLRKILGGADALLALVNDLLDMTRIQAGAFHLAVEPMDFREVARRTLESLGPMAQRKHQTLADEVPAGLPELTADPQRVGQVIANLVGNAIKFTPEGGRIFVRARLIEGRLRCEVQDDGPGIPPEALPRLFERFTQLDMSATRAAGGVGLGLSIAKALVEAHGGAIGASCGAEQGCTFWFTLPTGSPTAPEASDRVAAPRSAS